MIVENRDVVRKSTEKNLVDKLFPILTILTVLSAAGALVFLILNSGWIFATLAGVILPYSIGQTIVSNKLKSFDREMAIFEAYLKSKGDMEELSKTDPNITAYLSKSATKELNHQETLKQAGTIEHTLNIDFMDKVSLQDLRQLLSRYMISKSLLEE